MGKANQFINYASPLLLAKLLKRRGENTKYSFTVKINDFIHSGEIEEKTYTNTLSVKYNDETLLTDTGSVVISGDTKKEETAPQLVMKFISDNEVKTVEESQKGVGYCVSPSCGWRLTYKGETLYQGTFGEGATVIGGLFNANIEYQQDQGGNNYYIKTFEITSNKSCSLFDELVLEITPVFNKIENNKLIVNNDSSIIESGVGLSTFWFKESPSVKDANLSEFIYYPDASSDLNYQDIYISIPKHTHLSKYQIRYTVGSEETTTQGDVTQGVDFTEKPFRLYVGNSEGIPVTPSEVGQIVISPKNIDDNTTITLSFCGLADEGYEKYSASLYALSAPDSFVQINDEPMGKQCYAFATTSDTLAYKTTCTRNDKFGAWFYVDDDNNDHYVSINNPYNTTVSSSSKKELKSFTYNFSIKKAKYYGTNVRVTMGETPLATACDYYGYGEDGATIKCELMNGDQVGVIPTGFSSCTWKAGEKVIATGATCEFVLGSDKRNITYTLTLAENYGVIYTDIYPTQAWYLGEGTSAQDVTLKVGICPVKNGTTVRTKKEIALIDDWGTEGTSPENQPNAWTPIITGCQSWDTKPINLADGKEYFVRFESTPPQQYQMCGVDWTDAVKPQSWGGAFTWIYNYTLSSSNNIISLSNTVKTYNELAEGYMAINIVANPSSNETNEERNTVMILGEDMQTYLSMREDSNIFAFKKSDPPLIRFCFPTPKVGFTFNETRTLDKTQQDDSTQALIESINKTGVSPYVGEETYYIKLNKEAIASSTTLMFTFKVFFDSQTKEDETTEDEEYTDEYEGLTDEEIAKIKEIEALKLAEGAAAQVNTVEAYEAKAEEDNTEEEKVEEEETDPAESEYPTEDDEALDNSEEEKKEEDNAEQTEEDKEEEKVEEEVKSTEEE